MTTARWMTGDVFERMAEIPDGSVDLVMTSPPFLCLRSYLPADHPDKHKEIGQEPTPAEFLDTLLALTAEWRRVLAPHGSIAVELGDTYSGSGGAGGDYNPGGLREGQSKFDGSNHRRGRVVDHDSGRRNPGPGWPLAKSLCGIPTLYAWSLAYGRNLLTGEESPAGQWRIRNVVAWVRPNPPVGALGDKFRPATSYLTIACTSPRRYFDLDAVRTPLTEPGRTHAKTKGSSRDDGWGRPTDGAVEMQNPAGAPPLDWWEIPTQPYSGSHYATYPEALCVRPIEAMCPRRVCTTCGKPSERIVGDAEYIAARQAFTDETAPGRGFREAGLDRGMSGTKAPAYRDQPTLGWTCCGHGDDCKPAMFGMNPETLAEDGPMVRPPECDGSHWRPGVVLDPFAGSGTTLAVATARGRDAIGIDLDPRNLDLARERIGMWLVEDTPKEAST